MCKGECMKEDALGSGCNIKSKPLSTPKHCLSPEPDSYTAQGEVSFHSMGKNPWALEINSSHPNYTLMLKREKHIVYILVLQV